MVDIRMEKGKKYFQHDLTYVPSNNLQKGTLLIKPDLVN